jgi:hypothetical protein
MNLSNFCHLSRTLDRDDLCFVLPVLPIALALLFLVEMSGQESVRLLFRKPLESTQVHIVGQHQYRQPEVPFHGLTNDLEVARWQALGDHANGQLLVVLAQVQGAAEHDVVSSNGHNPFRLSVKE